MILKSLHEKRGFVWQVGGWSDQHAELSEYLTGAKEGVWFLTNPITGTCIDGSWRSEANLTSFRYLLVESDKASKDLWIRLLVQLEIPIVSIVDSGGKSIHALVRVPARNAEELRKEIAHCQSKLSALGLDVASNRVVQLSRLPRVLRRNKMAMQRLLWLNPTTGRTSIMQEVA